MYSKCCSQILSFFLVTSFTEAPNLKYPIPSSLLVWADELTLPHGEIDMVIKRPLNAYCVDFPLTTPNASSLHFPSKINSLLGSQSLSIPRDLFTSFLYLLPLSIGFFSSTFIHTQDTVNFRNISSAVILLSNLTITVFPFTTKIYFKILSTLSM